MADHAAQQSVPSSAAMTTSNSPATTMPLATSTITMSLDAMPMLSVQQPNESTVIGTAGDNPVMDQPMDLTLDEDDPDAVVWYDDDDGLEEGEIIMEGSNIDDLVEV